MSNNFNFNKNEYEYTWGGTGFTLLFQSLFVQVMRLFPFMDTFYLNKNNELQVYISHASLTLCSEYGKECLSDKEKIIALCEQTQKEAEDLLRLVIQKEDLLTSWERFNVLSQKFLFDYSKLDPYFSDAALSILNDQEILLYLGEQKNNLREKLNAIYFTDNSKLISLLTAIGDQFSVAVSDLQDSTTESISLKLKDASEVLLCKKDFIVWAHEGAISYTFDDKIIEYVLNEFAHAAEKTNEEIVGTSVSKKGVFRGMIKKIVLDYTKLDDTISLINSGDEGFILVADHTTPELLPIMKKSIAIITDMGGLLSHASITARELSIPCIVGTKVATQVLHDGDTVELDADKGIVKILATKNSQ